MMRWRSSISTFPRNHLQLCDSGMTRLDALGQVIFRSHSLHMLSQLFSPQGNLRRSSRLFVRHPASPPIIMTHLLDLGLGLGLLPLDFSLHLNPLHRGLGGSPLLLSHAVRTLRIRRHHWYIIIFNWTKPALHRWTGVTHFSLRVC
jgi:hypothetical protein